MRIREMNGLIKSSVVLAQKMILTSDYVTREEIKYTVRKYLEDNGIVLNTNVRKDRRLLHFIVKGAEYIAFDNVSYDNAFYYIQASMKKRGVNLYLA